MMTNYGRNRYRLDRVNRHRRGVISIFLAIVLPLIIVMGFLLYDYLYLRHRDTKALKVVYAVSEAKLARYNDFLKEEYFLFANLESLPLEEYVGEYMSLNGFQSTSRAELMSLDNPKYFRQTVVRSAKGLIADTALDLVKRKLGIDVFEDKIMAKVSKIDQSLEGLSLLLTIPNPVRKLKYCDDVTKVKKYIERTRDIMETNSLTFDNLTGEIYEEAGTIEHTEISGLKTEDMEKLERAYVEQKEEIENYLSRVEHFLEPVEVLQETVEDLEDRIHSKLSSISNIETALELDILTAEQRERYEEKLEDLEEEVEELEEELEEPQEELYEAEERLYECLEDAPELPETSMYEQFLGSVKTGLEALATLFEMTGTEAKTLMLMNDFTKKPYSNFGGSEIDKLLINEWCLRVFSSYDKGCTIEKRPIKGELEYLVSGSVSEVASMAIVKLKISGLRTVPNFITFLGTDARRDLDNILNAIPSPYCYIAKAVAYTAMSFGESYLDVERLLKGEKIRLIKRKTEWRLSIHSLLNASFSDLTATTSGADSWDRFSYEDYLRVLLYLQSEEDTILRAMNIMDATLYVKSGRLYSLSDFSVGHVVDVDYENQSIFRSRQSTIHFVNSYD